MPFSTKCAPITASGSGFHFIFELRVLELIENEINIDRCSRRELAQKLAASDRCNISRGSAATRGLMCGGIFNPDFIKKSWLGRDLTEF